MIPFNSVDTNTTFTENLLEKHVAVLKDMPYFEDIGLQTVKTISRVPSGGWLRTFNKPSTFKRKSFAYNRIS